MEKNTLPETLQRKVKFIDLTDDGQIHVMLNEGWKFLADYGVPQKVIIIEEVFESQAKALAGIRRAKLRKKGTTH